MSKIPKNVVTELRDINIKIKNIKASGHTLTKLDASIVAVLRERARLILKRYN